MAQREQDVLRRWFEQVWNQGRREAIAEMLSPDAVLHEGGLDSRGPDGFYSYFDRMNASLSDIHVVVEDVLGDGDTVCVRWSFTARHTGDGLGMAPTGKTVNATGISIARVANGQLVEGWQNWDMLGLLEQIKGVQKSATYVGA